MSILNINAEIKGKLTRGMIWVLIAISAGASIVVPVVLDKKPSEKEEETYEAVIRLQEQVGVLDEKIDENTKIGEENSRNIDSLSWAMRHFVDENTVARGGGGSAVPDYYSLNDDNSLFYFPQVKPQSSP